MREDTARGRRWRWLSRGSLLILAGVLAFMVSQGSGVRADPGYNPEPDIELSDYDSEANPDITSIFAVEAPDVNFDEVLTFTPPEFGVASDVDVPEGTVVGELLWVQTLGLANAVCNIPLNVPFTLHDATTDTSNSFTYDAATEPIGGASWPGYDVMPSGNERGVDEYPDFLNDMFPGITPRARYYGHTYISAAVTHVALQFLVFEPGRNLPGLPSFPADWGYPSVTVLNDPTAPLGPSAITDFCTPLTSTNTVYGTADGIPIRTNPPYGGTYTFRSWSRGLPDADGDGLENDLDTCPYDVNVGSPRVAPGEGDGDEEEGLFGDGIDAACDEDPASPCGPGMGDDAHLRDCDRDGYENRGDNCPWVANGPAGTNQVDTDEDGIGDDCDDYPTSVDGPGPEVMIEIEVDISGPAPPVPEDTDRDGFDDVVEAYLDTDPLDACPDDPTHDAWPLDMDMDRAVTFTGDVYAYVGKIGATPSSPNWSQRLDLDMDSAITFTGDVYLFIGKIGLTCT